MRIHFILFDIYIESLFIFILSISILPIQKLKDFLSPYFMCYLFIVFHELGHIFVGTFFGKKLSIIRIYSVGINAVFKKDYERIEMKKYLVDLVIYLAGPISNIILALIFQKYKVIFEINMFLGIINLLPIYPLDGYSFLKILFKILSIKKEIIKYISMTFVIFLILLSTAQIYFYKNPSLLFFLIYILNLNIRNNDKK